MRNEYFELIDNVDVVKYLNNQIKDLQNSITDIRILDEVKNFVESGRFSRDKAPFDNKVELISYIAFKRSYKDRHPSNSNNN